MLGSGVPEVVVGETLCYYLKVGLVFPVATTSWDTVRFFIHNCCGIMFLTMRSPFGGRMLSSMWASIKSDRNLTIRPSRKPELVEDYIVYKVGYAEKDVKAGDPIFIKRSDYRHLRKVGGRFE